jgi:hypothetical protein
MAYLHCHACNWEQDDFWSKAYNPWTVLLDRFSSFIRPRFIEVEGGAEENYHIVRIHCWHLLLTHTWWCIRRMFRQVYWTYRDFQDAVKENGGKWPTCPKCGKPELDID